MSCQDFFASLAGNADKTAHFDELCPACACEASSMSPHSAAGVVNDDETVWRLILSPIHFDTQTGRVKEAAFSDAWGRGLSVLRGKLIDNAGVLRRRGVDRAGNSAVRKFECAAGAQVGMVRSLRSADGAGRFCVYDTAEQDEPAHADICQTRHAGKAAQKQLRRELQKLFTQFLSSN